jgi:hypothetical protein
MRHFFLISVLVCWTLLFTGAMDRGALFSSPPRQDVFLPRSEESGAGLTLGRALAALAGDRLLWLETSIRQEMFGDNPFQAEGRYLLGPDQRMRLELRIASAGKTSRVLIVSDGKLLRQCRWKERRPEPLICDALPERNREEFMAARGLGGLPALLRQIHQSLQEPVQQEGVWRGRPAIRVSGVWGAPEDALKLLPPGLRARRCNVILDAETLWPWRIEWLGSPRPFNYPIALLQMDFRDPVLNRALSPSECAREFRLPGE